MSASFRQESGWVARRVIVDARSSPIVTRRSRGLPQCVWQWLGTTCIGATSTSVVTIPSRAVFRWVARCQNRCWRVQCIDASVRESIEGVPGRVPINTPSRRGCEHILSLAVPRVLSSDEADRVIVSVREATNHRRFVD
jgi:hypothetical protein